MDKELDGEDLALKLTALYMEWQYISENGTASTVWTDGQELNYIRRKIEMVRIEMESAGYFPGIYYHELPVLMKIDYMKDADQIRTDAKEALKAYLEDENYRYILESAEVLGEREREMMRSPPEPLLLNVRKLQTAINADYVLGMKKYLDIEKMLFALKRCRVELQAELEDVVPF